MEHFTKPVEGQRDGQEKTAFQAIHQLSASPQQASIVLATLLSTPSVNRNKTISEMTPSQPTEGRNPRAGDLFEGTGKVEAVF